jgi:transposase-like protein
MGLLERHGEARVKVVGTRRKKDVHAQIREHVEPGSNLYSDALKSYEGLDEYVHEFIDHAEEYVRGQVHTNGMENFWSLFKRSLKGTYVSVEPFHLQSYADEQAFRFNNRKCDDVDRFRAMVSGIAGKRLTYAELTGKTSAEGGASPEPF